MRIRPNESLRHRVAGLALALLAASSLAARIEEPIKVEGGLVSGIPGWAWNVRAYHGIPFAAPPVGSLRWKAPQPVVPWQGVLSARKFGPPCMQAERSVDSPATSPWIQSLDKFNEDCLYLNVWTPAGSASDKLPVMIWIYGGGGVSGWGGDPRYGGDEIAKKGVVVVTLNYRVNIFGWFAHPELSKESDPRVSGNYGSLDQLAAIKWAKNNIAAFGGDPDKITIWGQSGGSRSVNFLAASPLARGLFRGAIAESHTSFGRMETLKEAEARGVEFAKAAGKTSLAELRAMSAEDLFAAFQKNQQGWTGAVVDGWFLPEDVYTIYLHGKQNDVPLLTGVTNDEAGSVGGGRGQRAPNSLAAYDAWAKSAFGAKADELLRLYPAKNDAEAQKAYHDVYRDINFAGHRTWAQMQLKTGKSPVYIYNFSHIAPAPEGNGNTPTPIKGAVHFSEVVYVFNNLRLWDYPWTDIDRKVADSVSSYWTNFAKNLNPNGHGLPEWSTYKANGDMWLNVGDTIKMEKFNGAGVALIESVLEERRGTGEPER